MKRPDKKLLKYAGYSRSWSLTRNTEGLELFNWLVVAEHISVEYGVMSGNVKRAEILESLAYDGIEVKS